MKGQLNTIHMHSEAEFKRDIHHCNTSNALMGLMVYLPTKLRVDDSNHTDWLEG